MKKIIVLSILSLILLPLSVLWSQTYDLQFVEMLNNGSNFNVKVQIKASSAFKLAASNITFNFNTAGLSNPTLLTAHNFNGFVAGPPTTIYGTMTVTNPLSNVASINIVFTFGDAAFAGLVGTDWTDVATIGFTTENSTLYSNLVFRSANPSPTIVYSCSGSGGGFTTSLLSAGAWSTLNILLPVELTSFTAKTNSDNVILNWETATEINNYGFEIERKSETTEWTKIGFVQGNGNSNSAKTYNYSDTDPIGGSKFQYRLKQIDNDGQFEYSDIVEIEVVPNEYVLYQNYPNPFNPSTKVRFAIPVAGKVSMKLYNAVGEEIKEIINQDYDAGYHEVEINASELASGIYLYKIVSNNFTAVKKLIIMK